MSSKFASRALMTVELSGEIIVVKERKLFTASIISLLGLRAF
jgi:hypothetical protein